MRIHDSLTTRKAALPNHNIKPVSGLKTQQESIRSGYCPVLLSTGAVVSQRIALKWLH